MSAQTTDNEAPSKESLKTRFDKQATRTRKLLGKDIWELEHLGRRTMRARIYQALRVLTLTWQGLRRNQIPLQSAALTFYSLIGIGPLIAFGIMISGFLLDKDIADPNGAPQDSVVVQKITQAITFAAPHLSVSIDENGDTVKQTEIAPEMLELINNFSERAKSGAVGVLGSLTLLVIGIQVLTSIEKSFNILWGVARGRKLSERIVTYWTFISLGAVLGTAALSLLSLDVYLRMAQNLPFGAEIVALGRFLSPVIAFLMITLLLAVFFRFIPNTQVSWKPAFLGAALVVGLLHVYKLLSFLYVQQVVNTRSLYGSVGIIVVLMLGLYIFWLLILLGGQVTYAVQNADYLTNENAWQKTSEHSREIISLGILLLIAKRFQNAEAPVRSSELNKELRVPSHILNSSINRLCSLGYLNPVENRTPEDERDRRYQPGRPLDNLTLGEFKKTFDCYGNNEGADLVVSVHPGIRKYQDTILGMEDNATAKLSIGDLIQLEKG